MAIDVINSITEVEAKELPDLIWQGIANSKEFQELSAAEQDELGTSIFEKSTREKRRINEKPRCPESLFPRA
jgi:hypothetical protein